MTLPTCTVTATIADSAGALIEGAIVTATLSAREIYQGIVVPTTVTATTNASGVATLSLWPNVLGSLGAYYTVRIDRGAGRPLETLRITVPNADTCLLHERIIDEPGQGVRRVNGRAGDVYLQLADVVNVGGATAASVTAEAQRAGGAEAALAQSIAAETQRAEAAEQALALSLTAETQRATAAEAGIQAATVRTIDAIMGASRTGLADGAVVFARGRSNAGDGGGGLFRYAAASTQTVDFGLIFSTADGVGRWVRDGWTVFGFSGEANVAWWGAKGDAPAGTWTGTENSTFFARAMTWCSQLYIPPGRYRCDNNATDRLRIVRSIKLRGAGKYATVLAFNDDASTSGRTFISADNLGAWNVEFEDFGVEGTWGQGGDWTTQRSHLCELLNIGDFSAKGVRFAYSRQMGLVVTGCRQFDVSGSTFEYVKADGCRVKRYKSAQVVWNEMRFVNDDCIAIHTDDGTTAPVDVNVVVMANTIVDSQGIAVLGGKKLVISGNTLTRPHCRGIFVGQEDGSEEGNTPITGLSITGNVIDTMFRGATFSSATGGLWPAIMVRGEVLDLLASGGYPGRPDGAGGMNPPYPYLYLNNTDEGLNNIGVMDVNISGNTVKRSLVPVSTYTDYGFGQRYGRSGPVSPAITEADLGITANGFASVSVYFNGVNVSINGNALGGGFCGVYLADPAGDQGYQSFIDATVNNNIISDVTAACLFLDAKGTVKAHGNTFDADPYHRSTARLANGKWASTGGPSGIYVAQGGTVEAGANTYRHMRRPSTAEDGSYVIHTAGETMYCDPAAVGYHTDNIGIAEVPQPASAAGGWTVVIEGGDPASVSDYGTTKSVCPPSHSAQPSAGKWLAGQRVRNAAPTVQGTSGSRYVVESWLRLTTGTGHVSGTDWCELRQLTGT